jgi:RNase P/RNase MRP subunit p30
MSESNGRHVIHVADFTLKQLDDVQRLVRQFKWGPVVAMTYVYLKAADPDITRAAVENLRSGDVQIIKDPNDEPGSVDDADADALFQPG